MNNLNAFVFPGQGSQSVGMLPDLASHQVAKDVFSEASEALLFDLWELVSSGPEKQLDSTGNTQPAILMVSIALWRIYCQKGEPPPDFLAGHSLGEYSALVASGALTLKDGLQLVRLRGKLMDEATPDSAMGMAAILGLKDKEVKDICKTVCKTSNYLVEAVNFNAPGQVVIAGHAVAVGETLDLCKQKGAKGRPLKVSVPAHTKFMQPAAELFAKELQKINIKLPEIPVVQNFDASLANNVEDIKDRLVWHIYNPVQWNKSITLLKHSGVGSYTECGPGKVLSGLIKRIDKSAKVISMASQLPDWSLS